MGGAESDLSCTVGESGSRKRAYPKWSLENVSTCSGQITDNMMEFLT